MARLTPWQYVFREFGLTQAEFARTHGFDRPKVSRALKNPVGSIPDYDKTRILSVAKRMNIQLDMRKLIHGCAR